MGEVASESLRVSLTLARSVALAVALLTAPIAAPIAAADAQQPRLAAPSRADSLLAQGRLAAAEDVLYAAADAKPRDPSARGALAAYLASRGRFSIALVLFDEAQRFGADQLRIGLARAAILPFTVVTGAGAEVTVPLTPAHDLQSLGTIPVRPRRDASELFVATIDPNVSGVTMGREAARRFDVERGRPLPELWIGERRVQRVAVRVDSLSGLEEIRIGLDVLWNFQPLFDERAGTLTLGRRISDASAGQQIPWLLTFPGLLLVPDVGQPPLRIGSARGRALLRGTRWQIDVRAATIRVDHP